MALEQNKFQEKFDKRLQLEEELKTLEKNIFDLETAYLEETFNSGIPIRRCFDWFVWRECASRNAVTHYWAIVAKNSI